MIIVRQAREDDMPVIVSFNRNLAQESEHLILDAEVVQRGVRRALRSSQLCRYYLAEEDGVVVGQTMVTYELTDWRDGLIHWIQSVYVRPESRGRGVFRRLYEHVLARARDEDGRLVRLYVEKENRAAVSVYEHLGMRRSAYHLYEVVAERPSHGPS